MTRIALALAILSGIKPQKVSKNNISKWNIQYLKKILYKRLLENTYIWKSNEGVNSNDYQIQQTLNCMI